MKLTQSLLGDMGVNLSGADVRVTEHGLHRTKVGAMRKQVRREGMPQGMG